MTYKANVLIIEDDLISAYYLKKILQKNDFNVIDIVDNAIDAIKIFKKTQPDIILMDIMLCGNISGCELAIDIRHIDLKVIIIFLSAFSDDNMIEYALSANAYSYLLKPYRDVDILNTMKMALQFRLNTPTQTNQKISLKNGYEYNIKLQKLYLNNQETILSEKLLALVNLLARNRGQSISYEQISHTLWQREQNINTIRSIVHRLKRKLPNLEVHSNSKRGYVIY